MKKKLIRITMAVAAAGALAVLCLAAFVWRGTPRGALPFSARDVMVYSKSYGVQGWRYYLRAKLPEKDFEEYVSRMRASHYTEDPYLNARDGYDIHWEWGTSDPQQWWDPSPVKTNTYGRSNGLGLNILKYEKGYVYYKSTGS